MPAKVHIILGLATIGMILGSGVLMSLFLLKQDVAQVTHEELAAFEEQLAAVTTTLDGLSVVMATDLVVEPEEAPAVHDLIDRVPVNTASEELLDSLPGIGPARAQAIIEARGAGPFTSLADLDKRVTNIPNSVLEQITDKVTFE